MQKDAGRSFRHFCRKRRHELEYAKKKTRGAKTLRVFYRRYFFFGFFKGGRRFLEQD